MNNNFIEEMEIATVDYIEKEVRFLRTVLSYGNHSTRERVRIVDSTLTRCFGAFMCFLSAADTSNVYTDEELTAFDEYWHAKKKQIEAL